jgi:hypothetical protein
MTITPAKALEWLENANIRNRPVCQSHVNKLARDLKSGQWRPTHEGIAFDVHGVLLDGQHRLWAIVESRTPLQTLVFYNVPRDSIMVINGGRIRTVVDRLKLANRDGNVSSHHTSTLRAMLGGYGALPTLTVQETSEVLAKHRAAVEFAVKHLSCGQVKGICNATTRAVIARAWYSADPDRLIQFCDILTRGIVGHIPSATVIVALRQSLMMTKDGSAAARRERYGKTQRALRAFLNNEPIVKLLSAAKELYPLPDEKRKTA